MFQEKVFQSKILSVVLICSFLLLLAPVKALAEDPDTGSLVGFVYGEDMKTPVVNAVVKIRNFKNGQEYMSKPSDEIGLYRITDIEEGRYILGVTSAEGDHNFEYAMYIKANEMAKLSVALTQETEDQSKVSKKCPRGESYVPEVEGECDKGYKWNPDTKRCECKRGIFAFFVTPKGALSTAGIVTLVAVAGAAIYGTYELLKKAEEASPVRK